MPSFDVVSKVQWHEIDNALQQAQKEVSQRFDFKGTGSELEKVKDALVVRANSEDRAKAALLVLQEKLAKRKVSLKYFDFGKPTPTSKGGAKIDVKVKEGIETEPARKLITLIKDSKIKVTAAIQDAQLRITGKNKDDLQKVIALLRAEDFEIELQYVNFRD